MCHQRDLSSSARKEKELWWWRLRRQRIFQFPAVLHCRILIANGKKLRKTSDCANSKETQSSSIVLMCKSFQLLVAKPSEGQTEDWNLQEDDQSPVGPDHHLGWSQYRGACRQKSGGCGVGPWQDGPAGLPWWCPPQPWLRQARGTINSLDGCRGQGGHTLAADVGQTKLLGGGQHYPETNLGDKQTLTSHVSQYYIRSWHWPVTCHHTTSA